MRIFQKDYTFTLVAGKYHHNCYSQSTINAKPKYDRIHVGALFLAGRLAEAVVELEMASKYRSDCCLLLESLMRDGVELDAAMLDIYKKMQEHKEQTAK